MFIHSNDILLDDSIEFQKTNVKRVGLNIILQKRGRAFVCILHKLNHVAVCAYQEDYLPSLLVVLKLAPISGVAKALFEKWPL